jgi:hypothetical protein
MPLFTRGIFLNQAQTVFLGLIMSSFITKAAAFYCITLIQSQSHYTYFNSIRYFLDDFISKRESRRFE